MRAGGLRTFAVVGLAAACLAGCGGGGGSSTAPPTDQPPLDPTYRSTGRAAAGDTFVHLFEWRWADVARECEVFLGPRGFKGVQVSPPSEHALIGGSPWWQRYQTVSYKLDQSRSGTRLEFIAMVQRCKAAGVEIFADAVINHMTAGSGTGSAGSAYQKYTYPAVPYTSPDFHAACSISSYNDASQVQNCQLVGLADLKTEDDSVRARIADYLIELHSLGVAGFRIDAAKHMHPQDLNAIAARVNLSAQLAVPARALPYFFLEVINNAGEAVTAQQYFGVGYGSGGAADITEFQFGYRVTDAFLGRNGASLDSALRDLQASLLPEDKSVVFVDNHDNQRGENLYYASTLSSVAVYDLANVYLLAQPSGTVSVMSSYGFDRSSGAGRDAGPPGTNGVTQSTFIDPDTSRCTAQIGSPQIGSWICEHRRPAIANMVAFRKAVAGSAQTNCGRVVWTLGDPNRIAFCRDGKGAVAINRTAVASNGVTLPTTGLPTGSYCNVARNEYTPASGGGGATCTGAAPNITVTGGSAQFDLPAWSAVAIHVDARL